MIVDGEFLVDQKFIKDYFEIGYEGRFFEDPLKMYSKDELISVLGYAIKHLPKFTLTEETKDDIGVLVEFNDEQYK